jgi:hypothetical protein
MDAQDLDKQLGAFEDTMNDKELSMYKMAGNTSFNQSMAQTLGGLAMDAAKAKPQV